MRRPLCALFGLALALSSLSDPARAAIGAPQELGIAVTSVAANSITVTTTGAASAGSAVFFRYVIGSGGTPSGVTDCSGNTYTKANNFAGAAGQVIVYYALNITAIPTSCAITATWTGTAYAGLAAATAFSGVKTSAAIDKAPASGTSGGRALLTGTQATGALADANELVLCVLSTSDHLTGINYGSGFTGLNAASAVNSFDGQLRAAYQIVSATTSVDCSGAWSSPSAYFTLNLVTAIAAPSAANAPRALLMGVGGR